MTASQPALYRVIVTGSRDWAQPETVRDELRRLLHRLPAGKTMTVVNGACPTGADLYARLWCADLRKVGAPVVEEQHPADWTTHGKAAGPIRNAHMVSLGADVVIAFIKGRSRGATHCVCVAEDAGIPVRRWTA